MEGKGFRRGSFQSSTSDEDLVEVAGGALDFSLGDDDPPLDGGMTEGTLLGQVWRARQPAPPSQPVPSRGQPLVSPVRGRA